MHKKPYHNLVVMTNYKKSDGGKSDFISCHPLLWKYIWKDPGDDANCEYCFPWTNIETVWLVEGSPTHVAIERIIKSKYLLKDLVYLTYFSHNGGVEVYNSLYNTFWPNNCTLVGMR